MGDVLGVVALRVEQEEGLRVHAHKLHHLAQSECGLPPYVFGMQRHEVVRVHDCVDEPVKHDGQIHFTVVSYVQVEPVELSSM